MNQESNYGKIEPNPITGKSKKWSALDSLISTMWWLLIRARFEICAFILKSALMAKSVVANDMKLFFGLICHGGTLNCYVMWIIWKQQSIWDLDDYLLQSFWSTFVIYCISMIWSIVTFCINFHLNMPGMQRVDQAHDAFFECYTFPVKALFLKSGFLRFCIKQSIIGIIRSAEYELERRFLRTQRSELAVILPPVLRNVVMEFCFHPEIHSLSRCGRQRIVSEEEEEDDIVVVAVVPIMRIVCRRFHVDGLMSYFDRISPYSGFAAHINAEMNRIGNPTTSTGLAVRFEEWSMDKKSPDIDDIDFEESPDVYADII